MSVFTWGCGRYGQLGNGLCDNQPLPIKTNLSFLPSKDEEIPIHVVCGSHCTFIVTNKQKVYVCGMGRYGRLGEGSQKDRTFPVAVRLPAHVSSLSSRFTHSCAVDSSGQVSPSAITQLVIAPLGVLLGIHAGAGVPYRQQRRGRRQGQRLHGGHSNSSQH